MFNDRHTKSREMTERARRVAGRRRRVELAGDRSAPDLPGRGPRLEGGRRRRQRVRRLPQRLRRDGRRPRASPRSSRPCPTASAAARTSPSRPRSRSSSAEHLQQRFGLPLWRFGNSGTEATIDAVRLMRAVHRPRHPAQDRGQLPRPPRRRDGVGGAARRQDRRLRRTRSRCRRRWACRPTVVNLTQVVPFNDLDALERTLRGAPGPGRRHDRRAVHDERRHRHARRRLPAGRQGPAARRTARCSPSTR